MTAETIVKQFGYKAERDAQGILTIKSVPIFVECTRGDMVFDAEWISAAVLKAKQAEAEGYLPPLHVRHHGESEDSNVRAAGFFRIVGTKVIRFKGENRMAVIADLVITDPTVEQEVLAKRLPYRSVEIFDINKPALDSLALLDHEAPYLELPMLMVGHVTDTGSISPVVANATFSNPWRKKHSTSDAGLVACFRRGSNAHLFYEDKMASKYEKTEEVKDSEPEAKMADDAADDKPEGENMAEGGVDVAAVVKAIEDGTISIADMEAILNAIAAVQGGAGEPAAETAEAAEAPAEAPVPGESMRSEMARLRGEVDATKARLNERDKADQRRSDIDVAMQRLEGKPMGADVASKLENFHKAHGPAAFKAYVDALVNTFASLGDSGKAAAAFAAQSRATPDVAMAYVANGTDAVAKAAQFAREYHDLKERGMVRMSEQRYVALNMERSGVSLTAKN